jgi:hypothetical protein
MLCCVIVLCNGSHKIYIVSSTIQTQVVRGREGRRERNKEEDCRRTSMLDSNLFLIFPSSMPSSNSALAAVL